MATPHLTSHNKSYRNYPLKCRCGAWFKSTRYRQAGLIIFRCPSGRFQRNVVCEPGVKL
jgi:hypothetical protein